MQISRADLGDSAGEPGNIDGCEAAGEGAIAQRAIGAIAPALGATARGYDTGVISARADLGYAPLSPLTSTGVLLWLNALLPRAPLRL